jgi:hypothetical protein
MQRMFKHNYLIVIYAIMLHFMWAATLIFNHAAGNATSVHTLLIFMDIPWAILTYFSVALLAIVGLFYEKGLMKPLCLLPQQFIMLLSAGGSIWAMWLGQFADGIQRSHEFLIADQSPSVIAAILHTFAIILIAREHKK